jgi:glycosyltransferase involved in cell wall biosynthesis
LSKKVVIAVNSAWNLVNFRSGIINSLVACDYEVIALAPDDKYSHQLSALGCRFTPIHMDNKGTNIFKDLLLIIQIFWFLSRERPDVFLAYTVKLNIYGSVVAHLLGIPVINNIAGLGTVFAKKNLLCFFVSQLYRLALTPSRKVFFQNQDDFDLFLKRGIAVKYFSERLPGSGVNIKKFIPEPMPKRPCVRFLLIARMLWEKGVGEFVEASKIVKKRGLDAEFCLLGFLDVQNPGAITKHQMNIWQDEGIVRYFGVSDDVRSEISQADCIVLPSFYREGTPRVLLEAAAMARPLITTDWIGCRDVVDDGINGYLCRPNDAEDLAKKMLMIKNLSTEQRERMGENSRNKVLRDFDERIVINKYLSTISNILGIN